MTGWVCESEEQYHLLKAYDSGFDVGYMTALETMLLVVDGTLQGEYGPVNSGSEAWLEMKEWLEEEMKERREEGDSYATDTPEQIQKMIVKDETKPHEKQQ